jgi:hypothetical protein
MVPHRSFLPRAVLTTSLSCGLVPTAPFLDQLVPSGSLISCQSGYCNHPNSSSLVSLPTQSCKVFSFFLVSLFEHNHPKFPSFSLTHNSGGCNSLSGRCSCLSSPSSLHNFFFRFGGLPLHEVHFLILRNPLEVPTTCLAIFPPKISYGFSLGVSLLPTYDRCPALHPSMAFVVLLFWQSDA